MPNTFKTTWFFEGLQPATSGASGIVGWTETWYQTIDLGIDAAIRNALTLPWLSKRLAFLSDLYRPVWVRCSDVNHPRNTKIAPIQNAKGLRAGKPSQVTCCVLVDIVRLPADADLNVHHRRTLLRGLPLTMIDGNVLNPSGAGFPQMVQFLNYLTRFGATGDRQVAVGGLPPVPFWQMQFEPSTVQQAAITALQVANGSVPVAAGASGFNLIVSCSPAASPILAAGKRVLVKTVKIPRSCNRTWINLFPAAAGGPYFLGKSRLPLSGTWDGVPGFIQFNSQEYGAPDQYTVIGMTTRHTGKPFRLTHGRRSRGSSLL